jgi:hypothetical protein
MNQDSLPNRNLDQVTEPAQIYHVIQKYLINKEITLRQFPYDSRVIVKKVREDGAQIAVVNNSLFQFLEGQQLSFFAMLAKYLQIDCVVSKIREADGIILLNVDRLGISKLNRGEDRVPAEGIMHISNLITAKTVIEANMFQIPTLVKVAFDDFKAKLPPEQFESVRIDIYKSELPRRVNVVRKQNKPLLIRDTSNPEDYKTDRDDLLSYDREIDEEIEVEKKKFQQDLIISELIVPIIYGGEKDEKVNMGYIWIQNRNRHLEEPDLLKIQNLAQELVQRILESNIMQVPGKIPVMDASRNGVQIRVENQELFKILSKQRKLVFDIYFPMQPPFTVMGDVRWLSKDATDALRLGLQLESKSDLPGERERYIKNLENIRKQA